MTVSGHTSEVSRLHMRRKLWVACMAIVIFFTAIVTISIVTAKQDPREVIISGYTNAGGCLHATPYDPARGAAIAITSVKDLIIATIVPVNVPDKTDYPALSFFVEYDGYNASIKPATTADFDKIIGSPMCVDNPTIKK